MNCAIECELLFIDDLNPLEHQWSQISLMDFNWNDLALLHARDLFLL